MMLLVKTDGRWQIVVTSAGIWQSKSKPFPADLF